MTRIWNSACGSIRLRVLGQLLLGCVLVGLWCTRGGAQGFGPDPFQPYNSDYSQYVWPVAPTNDYGYNSQALRGLRGANQFQSYMNSIQGQGGTAARAGGERALPTTGPTGSTTAISAGSTSPTRKRTSGSTSTGRSPRTFISSTSRRTDPAEAGAALREYNRARSESDRALSSSRANAGPVGRSMGSEVRTSDAEEKGSSRERDLSGRSTAALDPLGRGLGAANRTGTAPRAIGPAPIATEEPHFRLATWVGHRARPTFSIAHFARNGIDRASAHAAAHLDPSLPGPLLPPDRSSGRTASPRSQLWILALEPQKVNLP